MHKVYILSKLPLANINILVLCPDMKYFSFLKIVLMEVLYLQPLKAETPYDKLNVQNVILFNEKEK